MKRLMKFGLCVGWAALYFLAARGIMSYDPAAQAPAVQAVMLAVSWFCTAMTGLFLLISPLALAFGADPRREELG